MKKVNTQRFQEKKPENISFQASPLLEKPTTTVKNTPIQTKKTENERTFGRTNGRTDERSEDKTDSDISKTTNKNDTASGNFYTVEIPIERTKIRHSFDIFEDQKTALKKTQLAITDSDCKNKPILGEMIQEAIDSYIKDKSKKLNNLKVVRERTNERTNVRSETIDDINN